MYDCFTHLINLYKLRQTNSILQLGKCYFTHRLLYYFKVVFKIKCLTISLTTEFIPKVNQNSSIKVIKNKDILNRTFITLIVHSLLS